MSKNPHLDELDEHALYLELFSSVLKMLANETNRYANRDKNDPYFWITDAELGQFLGLLLLSGYNVRHSERDYWSTNPQFECPYFVKTMPRARFFKIKRFLHAADNQRLDSSKMAKVKPLYDLINSCMTVHGILHEELSIDESMIPYFGRHSCKQFIRSKPIRFGYKMWALCSSTGMPYNVQIYQGRADSNECGPLEPLGTRVVKTLLDVCDEPVNHHVYMDNFFTSYDLLSDLKTSKFRATGTVRENRLKKSKLKETATMKKTPRGSFDYCSDSVIEAVKWNDNSVVTIASNVLGTEPVGRVKRRVKGKGETMVQQPNIVKRYNQGMGGVDLMDRALSEFRPCIHGKKWYWPLLVNALNISVVYTYRFYCILKKKFVPHKEFRMALVDGLTKGNGPTAEARPYRDPSLRLRYDNFEHRAVSTPFPRKCVECGKRARIQCEKCSKTFHLKVCFQSYHDPSSGGKKKEKSRFLGSTED